MNAQVFPDKAKAFTNSDELHCFQKVTHDRHGNVARVDSTSGDERMDRDEKDIGNWHKSFSTALAGEDAAVSLSTNSATIAEQLVLVKSHLKLINEMLDQTNNAPAAVTSRSTTNHVSADAALTLPASKWSQTSLLMRMQSRAVGILTPRTSMSREYSVDTGFSSEWSPRNEYL